MLPALASFALWSAPSAHAHWDLPPDSAPWATPGRVRWCLDYSLMNEKHVGLMLDAGFNLVQGGSFTPEAMARLRDAGVHRMMYICSRTIYHELLFPKWPQLKTATILTPDQQHKVIYNNPARYAGCYNQPAWFDYVTKLMDQWQERGVDTIFFDNPMTWACYCPRCKELFGQYSRERTGRERELGAEAQETELERWFRTDTAEQFFAKVRAYARQRKKPLWIVANNLKYWLVARGVTDGVFTEAFAHPPFSRDVAAYKIGLAASHGQPTGVLSYIPAKVKQKRGKEISHGPSASKLWVAAPIAEEYELGYAEGLACGGNYIANYQLTLGRHIPDMKDPEDERIQATLKRFSAFVRRHERLWDGAQPACGIAVMHSLASGPLTGQILGMDRHATNAVLWQLVNAGLPADVVTEDDLVSRNPVSSRNRVSGLLLPDDAVLPPEAAKGLAEFVSQGGTLVHDGSITVRGRFELPGKAQPLSQYLPGARQSYAIRLPATRLPLENYVVEGNWVKTSGIGRVTAAFTGPPGDYQISVRYFDEDDGQGSFALEVDGQELATWKNDKDDNAEHTFIAPAVTLRTGSQVVVVGHKHGGEMARVIALSIRSAGDGSGLRETAIGKGRVLDLPGPLGEALVDKLKPLATVTGEWPQTLLVNVLTAPKLDALVVHLVNYDFQYDDAYALKKIVPACDVRLRVASADWREAVVLTADSAPVRLPVRAQELVLPEVRIHAALALTKDEKAMARVLSGE